MIVVAASALVPIDRSTDLRAVDNVPTQRREHPNAGGAIEMLLGEDSLAR